MTSDPFTVAVETITVVRHTHSFTYAPHPFISHLFISLTLAQFFWGPLSCLTYLAIIKSHSSRHFLQTILCTAHLYGVALYYYTNYLDYKFTGVSYSRPEFLYYWVYYVGFNFPWVIVPFYLLLDSLGQIMGTFEALQNIKEVMMTLKKVEEEKQRQKNE